MPTLAVVSYPEIEAGDGAWIESIRERHDPQARLLPAHVTLVFPADLEGDGLAQEISEVARRSPPIPFVLRWVRPIRDVFSDGGHVFLVPDDGFAEIAALHDELYRGAFASSRRADIPFIPHITVGAHRAFSACERIARDLTPMDRLVQGRLRTLSLLAVSNDAVTPLQEFVLEG